MIYSRLATFIAENRSRGRVFGAARLALAWFFISAILPARAEIQFDVFIGYDGITREAGWFPIACEVHNDGPPFKAIVEVTAGGFGSDQTRQMAFELPTNTRKRFVIPVFSAGNHFGAQWDARLLDEKGKVRAERLGLTSKMLSWDSILLGAIPRNFGGLPTLPDIKPTRSELKPQVARLQLEQFPDNPIALEGLDALYLNSEKAIELTVNQVVALLGWIRSGGHLILAVEQIADINGTPWLKQFLPISLTGTANQPIDQPILSWLKRDADSEMIDLLSSLPTPKKVNPRAPSRESNPYANLPADPGFGSTQVPVATASVRDGRILMGTASTPLMVEANRGRGKVTVLMFSPEREPFRSWKSRAYFWARLVHIPNEWLTSTDFAAWGGWSIDGVFGALIDSRQVKKLPVEWLLLLLVVYLIVIGPFDQYWLKKINRQMLTWITFPAYVVFFSLLIYFIGYKLRAGENEWNELQIVDILPRGDEADLRGRTYASIYSSANDKFQLASDQPFATLRGELLDLMGGGGKEGSKAKMIQNGNGFRAEIFVPVWTSLLYASDWFQPDAAPLAAAVSGSGVNWNATIENMLERPVTEARLVVDGLIFDLGTLNAKEKKTIFLDRSKGVSLKSFIQMNGGGFQTAVEHRRNPLGDDRSGRLENGPLTATVASFCGQISETRKDYRNFIAPAGLDLTALVQRGDAVLLAWDANHYFAPPINKFSTPRLKRNSFLRLVVPVKKPI